MDLNEALSPLQWILPFAAVILALVLFLLNFKGAIAKFREGDSSTIVLALVTLLCGAYGVERLVYAQQLSKRLLSIEERLTKPVGGQLLTDYDQIYTSATNICKASEREIKTLAVASERKSPPSFAQEVAGRLKQMKQAGLPARYDAVVVLDSSKFKDIVSTQRIIEIIDERSEIYQNQGVGELFHRYILEYDHPIGFDVIVVDKKHVLYGFTSLKEGNKLDSAILFENQPGMASAAADWFERSVLSLAKPYEEWVKEQQVKYGDAVLVKRRKSGAQ